MIKRYIKLLVGLIIVALIAIGAYIGVTVHKKNELKKAYEESAKKVIFDYNPDDTKYLLVHNSSGDFKFSFSAGNWKIEEGNMFPLNGDRLVTIAKTLSTLTADRILTEETPDDLSAYGLETPAVVGAGLNSGEEMSVEIGTQVPGSLDYYVRKKGQDTIYIVSESTIEELRAEMSDLKNNYLFDVPNTKNITSLKYIEGGSIVYDLRKEDSEWKLFTPFPQGTVNEAGIVVITSQIIRAQCMTFIDEEMNDLSKFGFDNPKYQLEIKADDMEATLIFGNYYDDNQQYIYTYNKELDQIYIFEAAALGFIGTRPEDVLVTELHNESFGNIKYFDLDMFGEKIKIDYQYSVAGEGETYYAVNGQQVDNTDAETLETFNNLINAITGLSFDNICENPVAEELKEEPAASIVYHLKEGDDYKLEFVQKGDDEKMLYIIENGKYTNTLIRKSVLENGVLLYYRELLEIIK